jgi:hypothetical protein
MEQEEAGLSCRVTTADLRVRFYCFYIDCGKGVNILSVEVECDMRPSYLSSWNRGRRVCVVIMVDDRIKSMLGCDLLPSEKSYLAGTACFLRFVNKNGYNKYT